MKTVEFTLYELLNTPDGIHTEFLTHAGWADSVNVANEWVSLAHQSTRNYVQKDFKFNVIENVYDFALYETEKLRQSALVKLTKEEIKALGL